MGSVRGYGSKHELIREIFGDESSYGVESVDLTNVQFSILVRTQGQRLELLTEALASIWAQREESYEVVLLLHVDEDAKNCAAAHEEKLWGCVRNFPPEFVVRVKLAVVVGGGRASPLNRGLEIAVGRFVCFLDDDDLLLDNHFLEIARAAREYPSSMVFQTYGAKRVVSVLGDKTLAGTYPYATLSIEQVFVRPFEVARQLYSNHVPICNFFVARELVKAQKLRFDDSYEVLEDWTFLMRVNAYAEVVVVPVITTVINNRDNGTNSVNNVNLSKKWELMHRQAIREFSLVPRIFSASEVQSVIGLNIELCESIKYIWALEARLRKFDKWLSIPLAGYRTLKRIAKWVVGAWAQ